MYSDVNGTIYFTDLFYTNCAEIPDVRWGYSPYYYDENETRWRRIPNSTGIFCLKAAVYTGGENFTDNVCGCWDVTVITGVYDYLNINELTATEILLEHSDFYYEGVFVDADNDGTTFNDWNWKLKLFHSVGEYVFQTGNNFTFGGLYYCLPDGYNWTLVDGKIQGEVVCYGYDSDGAYQEDTFPIEAEVANDCLVTPVISHFTQTPSPICQGSSGYVYVHLQQGSGTLNYSWTIENLPPGAYITPLGNKCRVTYPASLMSVGNLFEQSTLAPTNYIRCTVSNAVGSDSKSANVSMASTCDPTGCPTLAFGNGNEIVNENTMLINSLSNPEVDVTDYYLINTSDKYKNGNIEFIIHEPSEEHSWFDEIELWELKANKGEFIAVTDEGEFINFKEKKREYKYTLNDSLDVTSYLESNDGITYLFLPGDLLRVEKDIDRIFQKSESTSIVQSTDDVYVTAIGIKPPPALKSSAGEIYVKKENGKNTYTTSGDYGIGGIYFRDNVSTVSKRIGKLKDDDAVEIIFNNYTEIDYFIITNNLKTIKAEKLELISSQKGGENLRNSLLTKDGSYAELFPGEEIRFKYNTQQNFDKKEKIKHVLKIVGRYEKEENSGLLASKGSDDGISSDDEELPKENKLFDNYPNPFNPTTVIKYEIKEPTHLSLRIFDSLGRLVEVLEETTKSAGRHEVRFDGSNLSSGFYFYQLTSDKFNFTKKMLLVK
ncbi:hypothetical protein ASZ90_004445 [hydrocarbon metagenome]|uniref:Secretion system C-terminal sorting domain-containing protein n=1 Tax=hydrocarbon metagenome TaxID=938273 RepID=A0A0W8FY20_9ZZZZ